MMKTIYGIILLLVINHSLHAQLVDNKFDVYLGYAYGTFPGAETTNEQHYIAPALYSNYTNSQGYAVKGIWNFKRYVGVGLGYAYQSGNQWQSANYADFEGASIRQHAISPVFQFHTPHGETGLFNRFRVFVEAGPTVGVTKLELARPLFSIHPRESALLQAAPIEMTNDHFFGAVGLVGISYGMSQRFGVFMNYAYTTNVVSSKLYNDKGFQQSQIQVGLLLKFKRNKYFYY